VPRRGAQERTDFLPVSGQAEGHYRNGNPRGQPKAAPTKCQSHASLVAASGVCGRACGGGFADQEGEAGEGEAAGHIVDDVDLALV
jgi:hypothetical protein